MYLESLLQHHAVLHLLVFWVHLHHSLAGMRVEYLRDTPLHNRQVLIFAVAVDYERTEADFINTLLALSAKKLRDHYHRLLRFDRYQHI